jgi:hypothetical protein
MEAAPWLIIGGSVLGFLLFWFFLMFLIAGISGWKRIAAAHPFYPGSTGAEVERIRFGSMNIGFNTKYGNAITFTLYEAGVLIRPGLLLRAFHPPIFLDKSVLKKAKYSGTDHYGMLQLELEGKLLFILGKAAARLNTFAHNKNLYF